MKKIYTTANKTNTKNEENEEQELFISDNILSTFYKESNKYKIGESFKT